MALELTSPISETRTANAYQITQISTTFYAGGGDASACSMGVYGRKGAGDGAAFVQLGGDSGRLEHTFDASETLSILSTPVSQLPQDATIMDALMSMIDARLKSAGKV